MRWRKSWERIWDEVRYCSDECRRRKVTRTDRSLEQAILDLLSARASGATVCPSEAARLVASAGHQSTSTDWRTLMEPARRAARRLVARGEAVITQGGRVVDPSTAAGPIRIRRP